jgi:hypothetical protein
MDPTHPDRLVENVTAPSAGGFPDGEGGWKVKGNQESHEGSEGEVSWCAAVIPAGALIW